MSQRHQQPYRQMINAAVTKALSPKSQRQQPWRPQQQPRQTQPQQQARQPQQQAQQQPHRGQIEYRKMVDTAVANLGNGLHFGHDDTQVDPQTKPFLPTLRGINALGLVTVESQPGVSGISEGGETEQRGFVTGLLARHRLLDFLTQLRDMQSGCIVVVQDVGRRPEVHLPQGIDSLDAVNECCGNLWNPERSNIIMLTRTRGRGMSAPGILNPPGPNDDVWEYYSNLSIRRRGRFEDELGQMDPATRSAIGAYCVLVEVVRIPTSVPDVMDIILRALQGMAESRAVRNEKLANL